VRRIIIFISILLFSTPAFPYSDQITTERMLTENKSFIEFVNVCLSNFGKEKVTHYRDTFFEIYSLHFNAQVSFLQSDYRNAFRNIRSSQNKQTSLYKEVLKNVYLEDAKDILDRFAPLVIKSKNPRARLYLTLAYRDRAVSKNFNKISNASNPKLYSYKLHKYVEAIKFARRAKRYGFLALYESQSNEVKRDIYIHLFEMERESGNKFYNRFLKKTQQDYMKEINKTYEEYERELEETGKEDIRAPGENINRKGDLTVDKEPVFEKKVEKRVRFRKEKKVAENLINLEFDRAEDYIREYVQDFNFKIILATFEILSTRKENGGINYNSFFVHHYDNYTRLPKNQKFLLDDFAGKVKVVDDLSREREGVQDESPAEKGSIKKESGKKEDKKQQ